MGRWCNESMMGGQYCATHSRPLAECQRLKDDVVEAALAYRAVDIEAKNSEIASMLTHGRMFDALDAFEPRKGDDRE